MYILEVLLDWFLHFDQKLLIVPNAIANFFIGIRIAFVNLLSSVGQAIVDFISLVGTNIETQGQALANYLTNLGNSFKNAWKWVKNISGKSLSYAAKLLLYDPTMWLIEFGVALIMLSVEIVIDIVTTLFDYVTNRVPATIIDGLLGIPGLNIIPGVTALKGAMQSVISNLFKVPPEITAPDIAGAVGAAVSGIAKRAADAAWDAAKSAFGF